MYKNIIVNSKYFSVSDWLKSHGYFIITSFCWPNLAEFSDIWKMTSILQHNCQKPVQLTKKTWGRGWIVFVVSTKWRDISPVSRGRNGRSISWKHSKNSKNKTQRTTSAIWRIFSELNNPSSPKLANKQADELNINGGKHVYSLFLN